MNLILPLNKLANTPSIMDIFSTLSLTKWAGSFPQWNTKSVCTRFCGQTDPRGGTNSEKVELCIFISFYQIHNLVEVNTETCYKRSFHYFPS